MYVIICTYTRIVCLLNILTRVINKYYKIYCMKRCHLVLGLVLFAERHRLSKDNVCLQFRPVL
jgi:hypothetical protein